jgi:hypothetical protein
LALCCPPHPHAQHPSLNQSGAAQTPARRLAQSLVSVNQERMIARSPATAVRGLPPRIPNAQGISPNARSAVRLMQPRRAIVSGLVSPRTIRGTIGERILAPESGIYSRKFFEAANVIEDPTDWVGLAKYKSAVRDAQRRRNGTRQLHCAAGAKNSPRERHAQAFGISDTPSTSKPIVGCRRPGSHDAYSARSQEIRAGPQNR